ncbi:hypothetical protein DH86_00003730, partial [Scytalidium sp. 3C]
DKCIKWVNERLSDPSKGIDETTVGGIMLLTSLELCRGNSRELVAHMDGVERIASIRGGLHQMKGKFHFREKIQLIDLLVAIMLDAPPRFPTIRPVQPIEPPPQLHGLIQIPDSPLYGHCQLQDVLQDSPFCSRSIAILQHMQALTRTYLGSTSTGTTGALELLPI